MELNQSAPFAATLQAQPKGRMTLWQNNFLIIRPNHYSAFQKKINVTKTKLGIKIATE